jgi:hypothetical protein
VLDAVGGGGREIGVAPAQTVLVLKIAGGSPRITSGPIGTSGTAGYPSRQPHLPRQETLAATTADANTRFASVDPIGVSDADRPLYRQMTCRAHVGGEKVCRLRGLSPVDVSPRALVLILESERSAISPIAGKYRDETVQRLRAGYSAA